MLQRTLLSRLQQIRRTRAQNNRKNENNYKQRNIINADTLTDYLDLSNNEKLESLELSCAYLGGVNLNNCTNLINISLEEQNDYGVHTVSHIGEIDLSSLNNAIPTD